MDAVEVALEGIEVNRPVAPERLEPGIDLSERLGPEAVEAALCLDARLHEPLLSQHAKVLGYGWLGQLEPLLDVPHGQLRGGQQGEDRAPARLGDHGKGLFHEYYITT